MKTTQELLASLFESKKEEYDNEGDMAKDQLFTIADAAEEIHDMLEDDTNLPEWVQNKITKAADYLDSVRDYLAAENVDDDDMEDDEEMNEGVNKEVGLDELSKKTLGSYVTKASGDLTTKGIKAGADAGMGKNNAGDHMKKITKRQGGVIRAVSKLAKEDVEQIDEISKKTLTVQKATDSVAKVLGQKSANKFINYLKPGTNKSVTWDQVNTALVKQGVKPQHIAKISINALKEEVEKIDANKNGKIDAHDFKKLRGEQAEKCPECGKMHEKGECEMDEKYVSDAQRKAVWASKNEKGVKEEVELDEANFAATMKKAIAAHERGDHKRAKYHLDNAKTARYAMKSTEISKNKEMLDKYEKLRGMAEEVELDEALDPSEIASNPKMYDAATVKKAYYHKSVSAQDKQYLERHLDRHHGNKEWRKPVKEDVEQIDEKFDKNSKAHVAAKAITKYATHKPKYHADGSATVKYDGEHRVAAVDGHFKHNGMSHNYDAKKYDNMKQKDKNGLTHHAKRYDPFTTHVHIHEEVEQIDEISKKTLGSYVKKAQRDVGRSAASAMLHKQLAKDGDSTQDKYAKDATKDMVKRRKGIDKAVDRLTKEDIDHDICPECNSYPCECNNIHEKLSVSDGMGAWISDFKKSDAPQFKGKDEKERRDMAIAAFMSAKRDQKEQVQESTDKDYIEQKLADADINALVKGSTVMVDKADLLKAKAIVKKLGYNHKVMPGLNA